MLLNHSLSFCSSLCNYVLLQISIEDIHLPERLGNVSDLHDYPPKFMIHIQSIQTDDTVSLSPKLKVGGLDKKYYFELLTPCKCVGKQTSIRGGPPLFDS